MSSVYADVIVDITNEKLDRTFQYKVPPELTGEISPGTAVQIPFGNGNRTITGYVLSVGNEPKYPQDRMKAILAVQKDAATVETKLIALAAWMRHTYGSTMIQALKTVLPVKVKARGKETREIALLADPARCEELLENYRKKNYKARIRLLNALLAQPVLPGPVVSKKLKITADTLHVMEEQGVLEIRRTSTWRNPVSDAAGRTTAGKPNEQQQAVVDGSADLGYGPARDLEAGVTGELFFETSVHMLSLPQHPLAGEAVSWEQVRKADVIAVGRESIHYISADVGGEEDFHVAHTVHHMATAFALAATGAGIALAGRFSILLARGFGLVATPVYPVLRRAMLLYRPAQQELSSPAELFVSFTQEYARRHCLDSLPDDSLTALANTAG